MQNTLSIIHQNFCGRCIYTATLSGIIKLYYNKYLINHYYAISVLPFFCLDDILKLLYHFQWLQNELKILYYTMCLRLTYYFKQSSHYHTYKLPAGRNIQNFIPIYSCTCIWIIFEYSVIFEDGSFSLTIHCYSLSNWEWLVQNAHIQHVNSLEYRQYHVHI